MFCPPPPGCKYCTLIASILWLVVLPVIAAILMWSYWPS